MNEKQRHRITRLRQAGEALSAHLVWAALEWPDEKVDSASAAELIILDNEGKIIWRKQMAEKHL